MNKKELKELLKQGKKEELKVALINAFNKKNKQKNISDEVWKSKKLIENEKGFKFAGFTRRKYYYYFVSNIGRFILVKWNPQTELQPDNEYKTEIFDNEHWIIFQNPDTLCLDISRLKREYTEHKDFVYNSSTPLYNYVGDTWLKDEYELAKKIAINKNDRIELHHIIGNNTNCNTDNLIYIPNSIHACVHVIL